MASMIDTHALIKAMTRTGQISEETAVDMVHAINAALKDSVATKSELEALLDRVDARITKAENKIIMSAILVGLGVIGSILGIVKFFQ